MITYSKTGAAPPFASPLFPAAWTEDHMRRARDLAQSCYPKEAVGIVVDGRFEPLENRSSTPELEVDLSDEDWLRAAKAQVFYHSHPDGPSCPSESDMRAQQNLDIPFVVQVWPLGDVFCFGDTLTGAPLLGRAFRHGVHDCYSLVRDWYWLKRQLRLPDAPRAWEWWTKGKSIYADGLEAAGFKPIPLAEATQEGDGLLFNFKWRTPMHAALVMPDNLLLHHIAGLRPYDPTRLSSLVPRTRWLRHVSLAVRYAG